MAEHCPGIELSGQPLEIMETFCFFGDAIGTRGDAVQIVITRIRNGWSQFRDLKILLASRDFPIGARYRLYSGYTCSIMF